MEEVDEESVSDGLEDGAVVEGFLGGDFVPAFFLVLRTWQQKSIQHVRGKSVDWFGAGCNSLEISKGSLRLVLNSCLLLLIFRCASCLYL